MTRVALFITGLAGIFFVSVAVGRAIDLEDRTLGEEEHAAGEAAHGASAPAGLAVEQDGYRLVADRQALTAGRREAYVFRIFEPDGSVLRDYDVEHERRLHLIVAARSPNAQFLHLHPQQRRDGSWTVPMTLPVNGSYRVFADFTTAGERRTLGTDLVGHGGSDLADERLSPYDVTLTEEGDRLEFALRRDGNPVKIGRYLGARGHLVVLREGDFAYIHAHADEDELAFDVPFPSPGRYRLYLQFTADGRVETVPKVVER